MSDFADIEQDRVSDSFRHQSFYDNGPFPGSGMRTSSVFNGPEMAGMDGVNFTWNSAEVTNTSDSMDPGFQSSSER